MLARNSKLDVLEFISLDNILALGLLKLVLIFIQLSLPLLSPTEDNESINPFLVSYVNVGNSVKFIPEDFLTS